MSRAALYGLALALLAFALPAHAASHAARRVLAVENAAVVEGGGTVIAVTLAGRARAHLLRTGHRLAAVAVTDIDDDGDLDVVAASAREGLLLWRNAGGHFEFATPPASPRLTLRTGATLDRSVSPSAGQILCDRVDAALPAASITARHAVAVPVFARPVAASPFGVPAQQPSRAPPPVL